MLRVDADGGDNAHRLVPGNERVARVQLARVLLVIGAAETACLDSQQRIVSTDRGDRELALGQCARRVEDERPRRLRAHE